MEYKVKIDAFEGPLDLLLFMIKDMKVDIDDVNVTEITDQYLNFIRSMEELNLEVASEYLVMAAHLTYIKSKMILPKPKLDEDLEYEEEDPEEKLKRRLKLYKLFKDVSEKFKDLEEERGKHLTKLPTDLSSEVKTDARELLSDDVDATELLSAFNRVLRRYNLHKPLQTKIRTRTITIEERINQLNDLFADVDEIMFANLFDENTTRELVVTTFLAILELAKAKTISIEQDHTYDDILIRKTEIETGEINAGIE
ncbi:segregation and condensation protein A [Haloplasma contractile]|uniref:Segregation and condensation protein A n=1 Tax=Haloplasma contractile SSD-17B TaxID=1033810 RepID=F7Q198_9MOLU|nr:segregation/condensation protein A [Haloplasma contractile]ERJ12815.1 Segregation protein [Haloplasma contractile SSD-17B]